MLEQVEQVTVCQGNNWKYMKGEKNLAKELVRTSQQKIALMFKSL